MKITMKSLLLSSLITLSPLSLAADTTWIAGSSYKGTVTVPINNGPNVVWTCNGSECRMSGPWGNGLSLDSCQNLVLRIGKIKFYKNSAGEIWTYKSKELAECNKAAR